MAGSFSGAFVVTLSEDEDLRPSFVISVRTYAGVYHAKVQSDEQGK